MEQFDVIDDPVGAAGKTLLLRIVFPVELLPLPDLPRRTMRISFLVLLGGRDSCPFFIPVVFAMAQQTIKSHSDLLLDLTAVSF